MEEKKGTHSCCVPGCHKRTVPSYTLPNPRLHLDRFRKWLAAVQNPRFKNCTDYEIHKKAFVCYRHFKPEDFVTGSKKLLKTAVPSLYLPLRVTGTGESENGMVSKFLRSFPNMFPEFAATQKGSFKANMFIPKNASGDVTEVPAYLLNEPIDLPTNLDRQTLNTRDFFPTITSSISSLAKEVEDIVLPNANETTLFEDQETIDFTPAEPEEPPIFAPIYDVINKQIGEICGYKEKSDLALVEKPYFKALKTYSLGSKSIHEVCRICFHLLAERDVIKLYDQTEDVKQLKEMLHEILPNLDLEVYPDVVICTKCTELLAYSYQLRKTWSSTEEKFKKIVEKKKDVTNSAADLIIVTESRVGEEITEEAELKNTNIDHVALDHSYEVLSKEKQKTMKDNELRMLTHAILQNISGSERNNVSFYYNDVNLNKPLREKNGNESGRVNEDHSRVRVPDKPKPLIFYNGVNLPSTAPPRLKRERTRDKWGSGPYVCETCGFKTQSLISFRRHLRKHVLGTWRGFHPVRVVAPKRIMCDLCGRFFATRQNLERHIQTHSEDKIKCNVCGKELKTHFGLKKHIKFVHLGMYNYHQCHICGKQLSYQTSLNAHLKRHYGIKSHQCQTCARRFYTRTRLKNHMQRVHDSTPVVSCQYCGKVLKYHYSLEKHIRLYHLKTQDDKNVCEICKKPYWKRVDLVRHRIQVHGVSGSKPA